MAVRTGRNIKAKWAEAIRTTGEKRTPDSSITSNDVSAGLLENTVPAAFQKMIEWILDERKLLAALFWRRFVVSACELG